jgi:hypothetical protein
MLASDEAALDSTVRNADAARNPVQDMSGLVQQNPGLRAGAFIRASLQMRKIVFADGRKDFDSKRIFQYFCTVKDVAKDTPAIPGTNIKNICSYGEPYSALYQITRLFVGVRMCG